MSSDPDTITNTRAYLTPLCAPTVTYRAFQPPQIGTISGGKAGAHQHFIAPMMLQNAVGMGGLWAHLPSLMTNCLCET